MKKSVIIKTAIVIFIAVMCLFCLNHADKALAAVSFVGSVLLPIVLGLGLAFIINIPMSGIEKLYLRMRKGKISESGRKTLRAVSLNLSILLIAAVVAFVLFLVIPELARSLAGLVNGLSGLPDKLAEKRDVITGVSPTLAYYIFDYDKQELIDHLVDRVANGSASIASFALGAVRSAAMAVYYIIAALVITSGVLKEKERIGAQLTKLMAAYLSGERLEKLLSALKKVSEVFSKFITGQCLDACLLGIMFFITMSIFRFPYVLIISSLLAITALIPIFGAFVGLGVGTVLIFIDSPAKALWFIVLFFAVQQIDNNLLYPRVVGGSVGLPPLWTLLAVIIGGDLMGLVGMIFFIPLFSVVYSALSEFANKRSKNSEDGDKSNDIEEDGEGDLEKVT